MDATANAWLLTLDGPRDARAMLLLGSKGSELDVRETARCALGAGWSVATADRTSIPMAAGALQHLVPGPRCAPARPGPRP